MDWNNTRGQGVAFLVVALALMISIGFIYGIPFLVIGIQRITASSPSEDVPDPGSDLP